MVDIKNNLLKDLDEAEYKAWNSLSRYKFQMFGYWAAIWVHLNQIDGGEPNPFKKLVELARRIREKDSGQLELEPERE